MPKLTIVQRVFVGFAVLLVSIMILGGTAFNRLGLVSGKLNESYEELMPLLLATQDVPVDLGELQSLTSNYFTTADPDARAAIVDRRAQQYEHLQGVVGQLEIDINNSIGAGTLNFEQLRAQLAELDRVSLLAMELSDSSRELEESILLSRTTFFRIWQSLSVDMLRLQTDASRSVARRIRAFDRAGTPVVELFDELINAQDSEQFDRAKSTLEGIVGSMNGYVEQVSEDDDRRGQTLSSYRDRLVSYFQGDGSLLVMVEGKRGVDEQRQQAVQSFDIQSAAVSATLDEVVAAVQAYAVAQKADADASVQGANTLIFIMVGAAVVVVGLIGFGLIRSIRGSMNATMNALTTVARGDFTTTIDTRRKDEFAKVGDLVNDLSQKLARSIQGVAEVAAQLKVSASESLLQADETQRDTQAQKLQADSIATAINELESTVGEIANASSDARNLVSNVSSFANNGERSMSANSATIGQLDQQIVQANAVMAELTEHSQQITSVLDVISSIAEQTNLLALNAAIEAARAGESGRGFAVVADEVRSLADKTRQSTVEIKTMIDRLVDSSEQVSTIMASAGQQMQQCVEQTEETRSAIGQINQAVDQVDTMSEQIAEAATQQTLAVQEISQNVVQVAELAERAAGRAKAGVEGSGQVEKMAEEQQQLVSQFTYK